jgi:hypothetical protein
MADGNGSSSGSYSTPSVEIELSHQQISVVSGACNSFQTITPIEWDGASPDVVLAQLKALKEEAITQYGLKYLYKSYNYWTKLKPD